jgi:hypothetical protein
MRRTLIMLTIMAMVLSCTLMGQSSNVPISREAIFVESSGPAEVVIISTGFGVHKPRNRFDKPDQNELTERAKLDARRAAVWFVVLGGSDPMLTTADEKNKFNGIQESFFAAENIQKYIAWESDRFEERIKLDDGNKLRIKRAMRLNTRLIGEDLANLGVMVAKEELTESLGLPNIMVLPEAPKGTNPIDLLRNDVTLKKGAEVIESYLTSRRYDVLVPEQAEGLNELVSASQSLKDVEDDATYLLALSIGADVYMTYNITVDSRRVGSNTVKKASVAVRAFETTTARLLGTETGYSAERPTSDAVVIEEGINDAVERVLARISAYWKEDLERGVQYKVIVSVSTDYDTDEAEDVLFELSDALEEMANSAKEIAFTDYTLDYLVWVDAGEFEKSSDLYRSLKRTINRALPDGNVRRVTLNRKLIVLKVDME